MPGSVSKWRKYQKNRQSRHTLVLGITILLVLAGLIFAGKALTVLKSFGYSSQTSGKSYTWNGSSTINLVIKSNQVHILSFNPLEKSVTILKVPDDTYMELPFGFGKWPARSIFDLGQAENPPMGAKLLQSAASVTFGVPVDGFIGFPNDLAILQIEKAVGKIRQNPLTAVDFIRSSQTNLNLWEMFQLWRGIRGVRGDRIKFLDLGQSQITSWQLLPDRSRVLGIDDLKLDQYIQKEFKDSKIDEEGLSIGVFNATDHPQLAEKAGRVISNMGGRVIFIANLKSGVLDTVVTGKDSYSKKRFVQVFSTSGTQDSNLNNSRADINVILGEDYYIRYNRR